MAHKESGKYNHLEVLGVSEMKPFTPFPMSAEEALALCRRNRQEDTVAPSLTLIEMEQFLAELIELRQYADRCSEASGVFYEWDGGWRRGEIEAVERAIREAVSKRPASQVLTGEFLCFYCDEDPANVPGFCRHCGSERVQVSPHQPKD